MLRTFLSIFIVIGVTASFLQMVPYMLNLFRYTFCYHERSSRSTFCYDNELPCEITYSQTITYDQCDSYFSLFETICYIGAFCFESCCIFYINRKIFVMEMIFFAILLIVEQLRTSNMISIFHYYAM